MLDLLQQTTFPSLGHQVELGATTIWETWDAVSPDGSVSDVSQNHYAFGAVCEWMFQNLVGIDLIKPGWQEFTIAPRPTGRNHQPLGGG